MAEKENKEEAAYEDDEEYYDNEAEEEDRQTAIDRLAKSKPEDVFKEFDEDSSGFIDYDEFVKMLPKLGISMTEAKALKYFRVCDADGSGEIDIEEFKVALFACDPVNGNPCGFAPNKLLTPQDAFEMFDEDGSGKLDEDEFFVLLEYLGLQVSDAKQEAMFNKYDKDGSGFIDYQEFREIWLKVANVKVELANRGVKIPKYATKAMLIKKLDILLEQEEIEEARTLAEAKRYRTWQLELGRKNVAIANARALAQEQLCAALDAAGSVYTFGGGEHGQFQSLGLKKSHNSLQFQGLEYVQEMWRKRVAPTEEEMEEMRNGPKKIKGSDKNRIGINEQGFDEDLELMEEAMAEELSPEEKARQAAEEKRADDEAIAASFKFHGVNCAVNTALLWGRRVVQTTVCMNNCFALTDLGEVYCWGGHEHWWHEVEPDSHWQHVWRGDTTERSQKLLMTVNMLEPEEIIAEEEISEEEIEIEKLQTVAKYYDIWEPAPSAHTRLLHLQNEIMPKIELPWLQQSVEVRCQHFENKTKMELVEILYRDIVCELKNLGKRTHREICHMDKDIRDLRVKGQTAVQKTLMIRIAKIWNPLNAKVMKEAEMERKQKENARLRHEQEVDYNHAQWRKHVHSARFDHEPVYTERGNSRLIQVSGITERGAGLNTPRGMAACVQVVGGAYHAALVHADGNLYTWGIGASGRLGHDDTEHGNPRSDCDRPTLVQALRARPVIQCSLGYSHSAAVCEGNELYIWGSAAGGKLGLGPITEQHECFCALPTWVPIPKLVKQVSCGNAHTGAVTIDGELYMWGVADGGRLGLGPRLDSQTTPVLVESLLEERILQVSCGNNHTVCCSAVVDSEEGEGGERIKVSKGGDVYHAGAAVALGVYTPTFELIEELRGLAVRQVACGYGHSCAVSSEGELWAWGGNKDGCCGHPVEEKFVFKPKVVKCLFEQPANLALEKNPRQSSTYNSLGPERATDGNTDGSREKHCCHTQMDPQSWWEVDLGSEATILTIKIWNRTEEPYDPSMDKDTFSRRIVPCWVMISHYPFGDLVGGRSLEIALSKATARKRFKHDRRLLTWHCPENTAGRYVRIQLENMEYLHFAQVEVIGAKGGSKTGGRVASVSCGHNVTTAVVRPLSDPRDIEESYRRAVVADPRNLLYLRQYETFIREFESFGDCDDIDVSPWASFDDEIPKRCPLCKGAVMCAACEICHTWSDVLSKVERGPSGRLRRLDSIAKILLDAPKPPLDWEPPQKKDRSMMSKFKGVSLGMKQKKQTAAYEPSDSDEESDDDGDDTDR